MPNVRLIYLQCPVCSRRIEEPFAADGAPLVFVHRHSRRRDARLVVHPALLEVREIPHGTSMEDALIAELAKSA